MTFLLIVLIIVCLYLLALRGRTGHTVLSRLRSYKYAHRGLHNLSEGIPENSLKGFDLACRHGYGSELDVHLLSDGGLAIMHDSDLSRTTGREGKIEDLTVSRLTEYHLQNTEETIPTLNEVLETVGGRTPLIIELKTMDGNAEKLCETTCALLDGYRGLFCLESFDPRCILWLKKHRPELVRGQLAENSLHLKDSRVPFPLRFIMTFDLCNFLSRPDFIAYDFKTRRNLSNFLCRRLWGIAGVSWTLRSREDYDTAVSEDWIPIFEGFRPE